MIDPETRSGFLCISVVAVLTYSTIFMFGFLWVLPLPLLFLGLLLPILAIIISAHDLQYIEARYIAIKLGIGIEEARRLWFEQFNVWPNNYQLLRKVYFRTSIHFIRAFILQIFVISSVWLILEFIITANVINPEIKMAVIIILGSLWAIYHLWGQPQFNEVKRWIDNNLEGR